MKITVSKNVWVEGKQKVKTLNVDFNLQAVLNESKESWVESNQDNFFIEITDDAKRISKIEALYDTLLAAAQKAGLKAA